MLACILAWLRQLGRFRAHPVGLGERGECAAAQFLKRSGYTIIERRYRSPLGEIDLIVTDRRALVFVEVKTRRSAQYDHPAEAVDPRKQRRITRTALAYLRQHRLNNTPTRFDIIAITWPAKTRRPAIEHFPGAFDAIED